MKSDNYDKAVKLLFIIYLVQDY